MDESGEIKWKKADSKMPFQKTADGNPFSGNKNVSAENKEPQPTAEEDVLVEDLHSPTEAEIPEETEAFAQNEVKTLSNNDGTKNTGTNKFLIAILVLLVILLVALFGFGGWFVLSDRPAKEKEAVSDEKVEKETEAAADEQVEKETELATEEQEETVQLKQKASKKEKKSKKNKDKKEYTEAAEDEDETVSASEDTISFYGVWCTASRDRDVALDVASVLVREGFDGRVFNSQEWSNLNDESWYVVSAGAYRKEEEANAVLLQVRNLYPQAYVRYSGVYIGPAESTDISYDTEAYFDDEFEQYADDYTRWMDTDLSVYQLQEDDLEQMTAPELTYLRNSVYARHGYVFRSSELNAYFSQFAWYMPNPAANVELSPIEKANVEAIRTYQEMSGKTYKPQ